MAETSLLLLELEYSGKLFPKVFGTDHTLLKFLTQVLASHRWPHLARIPSGPQRRTYNLKDDQAMDLDVTDLVLCLGQGFCSARQVVCGEGSCILLVRFKLVGCVLRADSSVGGAGGLEFRALETPNRQQ